VDQLIIILEYINLLVWEVDMVIKLILVDALVVVVQEFVEADQE
jgi:hypothetical protein